MERFVFMVTEKEMAERVFVKPKEMQGTSSYVTAGEMKRFEQNKDLNNEVYKVINEFAKNNNIKPKYEGLEEICQLHRFVEHGADSRCASASPRLSGKGCCRA